MSDLFTTKITDKRKELERLLKEQAERIPDIESFSALAKRFNLDTKDLDELLAIAKSVFKASGVKIPTPKPEAK